MRPIVSRVPNPPEYVGELILPGAEWDHATIADVSLRTDAAAILNIPLCTRNIEDFWSWVHEKNGAFSVRSAYHMLIR